jgi:O-antigen ligase
MTTAALRQSMPQARSRVRERAPWIAYAILWTLFAVLGPYDIDNRANKEEQLNVTTATLKTEAIGNGENVEEGNIARRVAVIALGLFAVGVLWRARRRGLLTGLVARPLDRRERWLAAAIIGYILLAALSVVWADDPGLAARRVGVFLILAVAAYALARVWSFADLLRFIIIGCGATLLASTAVEILHGAFHPLDADYRLSGLTHPNIHAFEAAVLTLAGLAAARLEPEHRRRYWVVAAVGLGMMLLTRSRTSLLGLAAGVVAVPLLTMDRRRVLWAAIIGGAVAVVVLVFAPDLVSDLRGALLLGRAQETADITTLTGRTELWRGLLDYVDRRPILGWGFQAFWTPEHIESVSLDQGWLIAHAHSTYMQTLLELGAVGLGLFVVSIVGGIWVGVHRVLESKRGHPDGEAAFAVAVLVWMVVSMSAEVIMPTTHWASLLAMVLLAWLATGGRAAGVDEPAAARARVGLSR